MILPLLLGAAAAAAILGYAVAGRSATLLAPSAWRGPRVRKSLALTFDDGPSESTPLLLDLLAAHDVRATFFLCGHHVRRLPAVARQVRDAGHEIASHGYGHPAYLFRSRRFILDDVRAGADAIAEVTGIRPRWFRPPYGLRWFGLRGALAQTGLFGIQWTVIGYDWKWPAEKIARHVSRRACPGAILCLHDGRGLRADPDIRSTLDAVSELVPAMKARGFEFETVGRLLASEADRPRSERSAV